MSSRTRRAAKLGTYMQQLRLRCKPDWTPEQVAKLARCARPTITRMENGTKVPSEILLAAVLTLYGAAEAEREEALRLRNRAAQGTATIEHAADLPQRYLSFRYDEADAKSELTMDHVIVPGQLQTAAYAAALAEANRHLNRGIGWEQRAADERHSRQRLLSGPEPLRLHALIGEAVLGNWVGGQAVLAEQLRHLLDAAEQDNIVIQVVPRTRGAWGTLTSNSIILEFPEPDGRAVYIEHAAGGEMVEDEHDVAAFVSLFDDALQLALSPAESAKVIGMALRAVEEK